MPGQEVSGYTDVVLALFSSTIPCDPTQPNVLKKHPSTRKVYPSENPKDWWKLKSVVPAGDLHQKDLYHNGRNAYGELRVQALARIREQNNWKRFISERAWVRSRGVDWSVAWLVTSNRFPPSGEFLGRMPVEEVAVLASAERQRLMAKAVMGDWAGMLAEMAHGRKSGRVEIVDWVAEHVDIAWDVIDPDTIPSSAAVSLLNVAKMNGAQFFQYQFKALVAKEVSVAKPKFSGGAHQKTKADIKGLLKKKGVSHEEAVE